MYARRARNGYDLGPERGDPGEGELGSRDSFLLRNTLEHIDECHIVLEILFLVKARQSAAHVALCQARSISVN